MTKKVKRTISVIIAAIMLLSTMSVLALANDLPTYPEAASEFVTTPHAHVAAATESVDNYVQPTCVKEGSKEYFRKCTICGQEIPGTRRKVSLDKLDSHHQAGPVSIEKITEPTCGEKGSYYEVVRCVLCNKIISKTYVVVNESNCHVPDLPIKQLPDGEGGFVNGKKEATCAEEGYYWSVTRCKNCDKVLAAVLKVIPKVDYHKAPAANYKNGKTRTCADGELCCTICGAQLKPQIPHTWDGGQVIKPATATTQGVVRYTCLIDNCDAYYDIYTPVKGVTPSKPGDVNCDGKVGVDDARLILRFAVGLGNYDKVITTAEIIKFADMDKSGAVEPGDARMALRAAVGLPN